MLAEMAMKVEAARLLVYRAGVNTGMRLLSALETAIAKTYANQIVFQVANDGLQIHGGAPSEASYKDIRIKELSKDE